MALFFRIIDNKLLSAGNTPRLGFSQEDPYYIPDEYLDKQEFVIMRTCHGIGDWCIISGLPRLLKEKYPNCKVYIPSSNMLKNIFGNMLNNWGYGTYDCSQITHDIFQNNPYVDDFIDGFKGEIFHDHYRIYNKDKDEIPLTEQILKFWQFKENEYSDSTPDIYFSEKEKEEGNKLIYDSFGSNSDFGYIGVSSTYGSTADTKVLRDKIKEYPNLKWFYYGEKSIENTDLKFLKNVISVKNMELNIRQQMYLRTKAKINAGNETGMTLWCAKYSDTYVLGNKFYGPIHGKELEGKPRKNPFESGNFIRGIKYLT
tara:strand:+ start:408 stop:1349 length:942 start_codon:yes stop_codon:yes gene_type:complete